MTYTPTAHLRATPSMNGTHPSPWPAPVLMSGLPTTGVAVEWLWHGFIARGHVTLFSALMKSGKTTLVSHLLRALQAGTAFLGHEAVECRTLVISEESTAIWRGRRDALGLDDHLAVMCRPMRSKPTLEQWEHFVDHVLAEAEGRFDLVAFDTLSAFVPWQNENSSAEIMASITPLNRLTEAGLGVLAFHHHGKGHQSNGREARGSTALAGAVDVLMNMKFHNAADSNDRRRILSGLGRFEETPSDMVIALAEDSSSYTSEGDRKETVAADGRQAILAALPCLPPGATVGEIHQAMPESGRRKRTNLMRALQDGADEGRWSRGGSGKPKNPWRFWKPES